MADEHNRVYQKLRKIEPKNEVLTHLAFGLYEYARDEFIQEKAIKSTIDGQERLKKWTEDWTEQRFIELLSKATTILNDFSYALQKQSIEKILKSQTNVWKTIGLNILSNLLVILVLPLIILVLYLIMDESSLSSFLSLLQGVQQLLESKGH